MDLDVTFNDTTIKTPVYIKMNAPDQLLLSKGIYHQLGIISYHPDVEVWRGGKLKNKKKTPATAQVPTVHVRLLQTTRVPPHQSAVVAVQVDKQHHRGPLVLESDPSLEESTGLFIDTALIRPGQARILISNPMGYTQKIQKGTQLGTATRAKVVSTATEEIKTQALSDSSTTEEVTALFGWKREWPPAATFDKPHGRGNNQFTAKREQSVIPGEDKDANGEVIAVVGAQGDGSTWGRQGHTFSRAA